MQDVILTELGIAVYEEGGFLKSFAFDDPVAEYVAIKRDGVLDGDLVKYLSGLDSGVTANDESLLAALKKISIDARLNDTGENERIQTSKPAILVEAGLAGNQADAMSRLREFAINLSSSRVTEALQSPDLHVIQAINALDDTDKIMNVAGARMREWYGLHFPELENMIDGIIGYSRVVQAGRRGDLSSEILEDAGFPESKAEMIMLAGARSRGGEIADESLKILKSMAGQVRDLSILRKEIEDKIETTMREVAPNLSAILGTGIGARFIARAGSVKRLAAMPASTIQVLGAERALFRSLKTGSQPPKHGLLFQHPLVHAAPKWQRGKIARAIAAKTAIASRVDVYGGGLNETLLERLNVRVVQIKDKNKEAPVKPRRERDRPVGRGARGGARGGARDGSRKKSTRTGKNPKKKKRRRFERV